MPWRSTKRTAGDEGAADHLLLDPEFLLYAAPRRVTSLLARADRADSADVRLVASVYRHSSFLHAASGVSAGMRGHMLALDAARYGARDLSARLSAACPSATRVTVDWADGKLVGFASAVTRCFERDVLALGVSTLHGTEVLIVVEHNPVAEPCAMPAFRARDLMTGRQLTDHPAPGEDVPGEEAPGRMGNGVTAAAATTVDGRPVALLSLSHGALLCRDLVGGQPIRGPLVTEARQAVVALDAVSVDGTPYALTGTPDRTLRLWDLRRHRCVREFRAGSGAELVDLAAFADAGRLVAVVADDDNRITSWDIAAARPLGWEHRIDSEGTTTALAAGRLGDRPVAAVGLSVTFGPARGPRSAYGAVRLLDLTDGEQRGEDLLFPEEVTALCVSRDGRLAVGFGPEVAVLTLGW